MTPILPLFLLLKRQTGPIAGVFHLVFSSDGEWPPRKREENLCVIATATGDVPTKATSFGVVAILLKLKLQPLLEPTSNDQQLLLQQLGTL